MPPTSPSFFAALVSNRNCRSTANLSAVPIIVNIESGSGERASDAAISGQADYVTYVSNRPSSAKHEVWVYDRANDATHKVTDTGSANGGLGTCSTSSNKPAILSKLQAYWGDPAAEGAGYDMSVAGVSAGSYSSCQFLAAAGLSAATMTIEPQMPSISDDGRFVVYVTDYDLATESRVTDPAAGVGPVVTHTAFMYDRVLGVTIRLTSAPSSSVTGQLACCPTASASTQIGSCDHDDRLQGKCCDQKPCRMSALNAEISGDGTKVVFLAETAFQGSSITSPDGDLELYLHHIPTDTTHRISHSFDASSDETFPHINHDGTVLVWESKSHYGGPFNSGNDGNKDIWMTTLKYGCDDPTSTNYEPLADIGECCAYADATVDATTPCEVVQLVLAVDLAAAQNRTVNSSPEASCAAWHAAVVTDLACALRVPANLINPNPVAAEVACTQLAATAATTATPATITVEVALQPTATQAASALKNKLVTQLKDSRSAVWKGLATRYAHKLIGYAGCDASAASSTVLFTLSDSDDKYEYMRGDVVRVSNGLGSGTRNSNTPRASADDGYIVYESESDELMTGRSDGIYHIYRYAVATNATAQVTPVTQDSGDDSKYASPSADGSRICYYSNAPNPRSCDGCSNQYHWWLATEVQGSPGTFNNAPISWSSENGRKATASGRCQVSNDGTTTVFSVDSDLDGSGLPQAADYQVWLTNDNGQTASLISGAINNASDAAGITAGSDCYDPTLSADGSFVAFRCKLKLHPDGYQPISSSADDEGWLYDKATNQLSMFATMNFNDDSACAKSDASKADLFDRLQAYWGDGGSSGGQYYNLTAQGISASSANCGFYAAVGLRAGKDTTGVGADNPSMDGTGRFIAYTTDFQMATVFGPHDQRYPVTELNVFLYDRLLGITTRVTVPPAFSAVLGSQSCCADSSSSLQLGTCSWAYRLQGKCCDQKPCRIGGLNPEISSDGKKIVFISDVNYEGGGVFLPKGDLEAWVHHVPTFTTHRLTHTHDKSKDETFPAVSGSGTVVAFATKHHYEPDVPDPSGSSSNTDIFASKLMYGCDDPRATNYATDYDIPECCTYSDATLERYTAGRQRVTLLLEPVDFLGTPINATTLESMAAGSGSTWCSQWQSDVLSDLSCALRAPKNRFEVWAPHVCTSSAGELQVTVDVLASSDSSQESPAALTSRLSIQVKQASSPVWKGYATRYLKNTQAVLGISQVVVSVSQPVSPPMAPPPAPPATASVSVAYVVSQSVDDFTADIRSEVIANFATALGVDPSIVTLEVTAASARLVFIVRMTTTTAAEALIALIPTTTAAASTLLSTPSLTVSVTEVASVPEVLAISAGDSDGRPSGILVLIIIVGTIAILVVAFVVKNKRGKGKGGGVSASVTKSPTNLVSSQGGDIETTTLQPIKAAPDSVAA